MIVQPDPNLDLGDRAGDTSPNNSINNSNISVSITDRLYKHFSSPRLPPPLNLHTIILHSPVIIYEV